MPTLNLDLSTFPDDEYTWTDGTLELTESREQALKDFHSDTHEEYAERLYKEQTEAYARSLQPTPDTEENRQAVSYLARLMGRR
jgi:hypothetical protein